MDEFSGCVADGGKLKLRFLRDIEQAMLTIGKVQDPQQGHLLRPGGRVEAALPELRLALRAQVDERTVRLEDLENGQDGIEAVSEGFLEDEIQIVCGCVVLGVLAERRP